MKPKMFARKKDAEELRSEMQNSLTSLLASGPPITVNSLKVDGEVRYYISWMPYGMLWVVGEDHKLHQFSPWEG